MELLKGKELSLVIQEEIKQEVAQMVASGKKPPHLAAILVGNDGASETYVASKVKSCERVGFESTLIRLENTVSEEALLDEIRKLNENPEINGILVQLPLPEHIAAQKVTDCIDPQKDVDGFHPVNVGRMVKNLTCYVAATPYGIMMLLERYNIETSGKNCVVVGRSDIVGTPMSILLSRKSSPGDCTVTLCHSRTNDIASFTQEADIIVAALGKPGFLRGNMVKEGAVVIDVGITRVPSLETKSGFRLAGDVNFEEVAPKCSFITPVPGGVGPMTIAALLKNTLMAAGR